MDSYHRTLFCGDALAFKAHHAGLSSPVSAGDCPLFSPIQKNTRKRGCFSSVNLLFDQRFRSIFPDAVFDLFTDFRIKVDIKLR